MVSTSDSAVRVAQAYTGAYGVAKIALEALAKIFAEELESAGKVRVNTLIPGPVDSQLRNRAFPGENKAELPPVTSLAPAFLYLFSDDSIGVTGQSFDAHTLLPL